jgi:hypothetical protein
MAPWTLRIDRRLGGDCSVRPLTGPTAPHPIARSDLQARDPARLLGVAAPAATPSGLLIARVLRIGLGPMRVGVGETSGPVGSDGLQSAQGFRRKPWSGQEYGRLSGAAGDSADPADRDADPAFAAAPGHPR